MRTPDFNPANCIVKRLFSASEEHATITYGFAVRANTTSSFQGTANTGIGGDLYSDAGTTQHISVGFFDGNTNAYPTIKVYRGACGTGTLLGSAVVAPWLANQWYYIEVSATLSATVGAVTVKFNGTTIITLTGINTKNGGTKTVFDSIALGAQYFPSNYWMVDRDDLYVTNGAGSINNSFLGDVTIETLYPNANGTYSQLVGSDGNSTDNYLLTNEVSPDTSTYVGSPTSGFKDSYNFTDTIKTGNVLGVVATSYAANTDGGPRSLKPFVKSGATTLAGTSTPVVTTFAAIQQIYETDPNTSAPWTITNLNAAEFGAQVA